jgi:heavy metal translocating P-type ATPase
MTVSLESCNLCGLPLRYGSNTAVFSGNTYSFCCFGCRQVFNILLEATDSADPQTFKETDLFKHCQEKGIIPKTEVDLAGPAKTADAEDVVSIDRSQPRPIQSLAAQTSPQDLALTLKISNMWCPACAWLIDETLQKMPGISHSLCDFSTDRLQVTYQPIRTSPDQIVAVIKKLGYRATIPGQTHKHIERKREFIRLAICAFLTANVMMLSFALYAGFFTQLTADTIYKLSWPPFIMAGIVLAYGGFEFYKKAWAGITNAAFSMETLIIIGSLSAYFYSTFNLFAGSIHLYYDTAAMLITLVLLGKTLERGAKNKVLADLENFFSLMPTKVRVCRDKNPDGRYVAAQQLEIGDIFRVAETEIVPADGRVISGNGTVDESSLTGEPLPIKKQHGDLIRSGSRVQRGDFKVKAQKVGRDSTLGQMIEIIAKTLLTKTPLEGKTDVILQWFVPIILALAIGTSVIGRIAGLSMESAILRAVTVMVISCPCALGIAIPLARVAGISIAGKKGILVRDFAAFEMAQRITTIVFDKTGTITQGNWRLRHIIAFPPLTQDQALELAAGLEKNSDHFIGQEIMHQAHKKNIQPAKVLDVRTEENGVSGNFEGNKIKIGAADFVSPKIADFEKSAEFLDEKKSSKYSWVFMSMGKRPAAIFVFGDTLRKGAEATVKTLLSWGFRLALVSGDGRATTRAIAKQIGIDDAFGEQLPPDKVALIKTMQDQEKAVAMVGDGINDAPALVQSDLSLAVHSGAHLGKEVADVTLMRAEPGQVIDLFKFATAVNKKIHQNLAFTFLYNVISIPIAMSGLLTPLVAVSAMLLSSISVIGNTLLLVRKYSN